MLKLIRENFSSSKANNLIGTLIVFDLFFVAIHFVAFLLFYLGHIEDINDYYYLALTKDGSWAEFFQYLKYLFVLVFVVHLMYSKKKFFYLSWFLLFLFFLFDDALSLHEKVGEIFAKEVDFQPMLGLRKVDFGELAFVLVIGLAILSVFIITYFKGGPVYRKRTIDMLILLALMIFFGVGFDLLHVALGEDDRVSFILGLIEDGGEMVTMSIIVWYVFRLLPSQDKKENYLFQLLVPNHND